MNKKDERFVVVLKEGSELRSDGLRQLLVDKETGVTYLWMKSGYGAGLTVLLDKDGKPVITRIEE